MDEAVQPAGVIMRKTIDDQGIVLPVTELIWLWYERGGAGGEIEPALVGSAIVGIARVVRR